MTEYQVESYDVAVIGAGHAGIEAALAAARLGRYSPRGSVSDPVPPGDGVCPGGKKHGRWQL